MKLIRVVLACTLLLLVSVPLFARPQCGECITATECEYSPWSGLPCRINSSGMCEYYNTICSSFAPAPVLSEWTVASIEITRPAAEPETVTAPAAVTEAPTTPATASEPVAE
jgi:hypothetical protein